MQIKGYKMYLKKKLISFLMILNCLLPKCAAAQELSVYDNSMLSLIDEQIEVISESCKDGLCIDDYEIKLSYFKENEKHKFSIDSVCIDLFDLSIIKASIESKDEACSKMIVAERNFCNERAKTLFDICEKQKEELKLHAETLFKENLDLKDKIDLKTKIISNMQGDITLYQILFGASSSLFLGSIIYLILN